jgi:hypothetical protein
LRGTICKGVADNGIAGVIANLWLLIEVVGDNFRQVVSIDVVAGGPSGNTASPPVLALDPERIDDPTTYEYHGAATALRPVLPLRSAVKNARKAVLFVKYSAFEVSRETGLI